jgi:hypothetical protein
MAQGWLGHMSGSICGKDTVYRGKSIKYLANRTCIPTTTNVDGEKQRDTIKSNHDNNPWVTLCVWPMVATVVTLVTAHPQLPGRGRHVWIYRVVTLVWQEYIVYWQFCIIKQITRKITWIFNSGWLCAYFNYLINVPQARSCLSSDRDSLWWQLRSRVALNCKPLSKKGHFKNNKAKKNVLTNYIIKFRSEGSFFTSDEKAGTRCAQTGGAQRERIPDREIWRPQSSGGCTRHLPQRAVTLTTIVIYWLGDLTIPIWEVTAEVTALCSI